MELSDKELVAEALARVAHLDNQSEKARRLGVSESTVRRWLAGDVALPLRKGTREPLERFVAMSDELWHEAEGGGEGGSAAEELLHYLGVRAGLRRVARELTDKDLIAVAYTIARKDDWPLEELRKLDVWRDEILGGRRLEGD